MGFFTKIFKHDIWLADSRAASQPEAMLGMEFTQ